MGHDSSRRPHLGDRHLAPFPTAKKAKKSTGVRDDDEARRRRARRRARAAIEAANAPRRGDRAASRSRATGTARETRDGTRARRVEVVGGDAATRRRDARAGKGSDARRGTSMFSAFVRRRSKRARAREDARDGREGARGDGEGRARGRAGARGRASERTERRGRAWTMERRRAVSGGEDDSGADGRVGMHELPRDVVVEIVARLENERDLAACARSCAAFRSAARSESVWRKLLANKLGAEASVVLPKRLIGEIVDDDDSSGRGGDASAKGYDGKTSRRSVSSSSSSSTTTAVRASPAWMQKYKSWHRPESGALRWSASTTESSLEPAETKYAARYLHRCTAVGDRSKILFFGGQGGGSDFYNDLHLLDLDEPELRLKQLHVGSSNEPPFPRCSGTLTAMAVNGVENSEVVALFGGSQGFFEGFSNSLRILCAEGEDGLRVSDAAANGGSLIWREPLVRANPTNPENAVPAARWGHSAVSLDGKLILFGGSNTTHCFNDTWLLELVVEDGRLVATWTLLLDGVRSPAPPPRAGQTACLVGSSLYIFGGCHISEVFNDVWKLDVRPADGRLRWERFIAAGVPPAPRVGHAAVVLGDRIILCGGRGSAREGTIGKYATDNEGLASMQGLTFFQSGFAMLDTTARKWLPIQHPAMENSNGNMLSCERITHVREHRTGHVMMPARNGCLLLIGGLGYDGVFQNDLSLVSLF